VVSAHFLDCRSHVISRYVLIFQFIYHFLVFTPASEFIDKNASSVGVEKLPEEMNDMKIRDDKVNKFFFFEFFVLE
jgi:hypothetical protein